MQSIGESILKAIVARTRSWQKKLSVYSPGDTIWIHDFHWMLVPKLIRDKIPAARIGFFLYIPFPNYELIDHLPKHWRQALLEGLMGADLIAFQTSNYLAHFKETIKKYFPRVEFQKDNIFNYGHLIHLSSLAMSVDYGRINQASKSPEISEEIKRIRNRAANRKLILSIERQNYTTAILNRLESFELFLELNPHFRGKVTYVMVTIPVRRQAQKYKENKAEIEAFIGRINGAYGTMDWVPIIYQHRTMDSGRLAALYSACDVALVVPIRDGMNLIAKEYVASRANSDGVLILSETAGPSTELSESITVSATDRKEIADSILNALQMSHSEQHRRMEIMQNYLQTHDIYHWIRTFLTSLIQLTV